MMAMLKLNLKRWYRWLLAVFHLSESAVCEFSRGLGPDDYHDYDDTEEGQPYHFVLLTCKRCGKTFYI